MLVAIFLDEIFKFHIVVHSNSLPYSARLRPRLARSCPDPWVHGRKQSQTKCGRVRNWAKRAQTICSARASRVVRDWTGRRPESGNQVESGVPFGLHATSFGSVGSVKRLFAL